MRRRWVHGLKAYVAGVLAAYVCAAVSYTQLNLGNVIEMGLSVTLVDRLAATWHDLLGLNLLLVLIAVGFAVAFFVASWILRWLPQLRHLGYILAGGAAIYMLDYAMYKAMGDMHVLAVTRTGIGVMILSLAGAVGGYVFVRLLPEPN